MECLREEEEFFILGYHKSTTLYKRLKKQDKISWLDSDGTLAKGFPREGNKFY